jgi:hypothetical protein
MDDASCFGCSLDKLTTSAECWDGLMGFIIMHRPMVVHQFWIDKQEDKQIYSMSYSLIRKDSSNHSEV